MVVCEIGMAPFKFTIAAPLLHFTSRTPAALSDSYTGPYIAFFVWK